MIVRLNIRFLLLFCIIAITSHAQSEQFTALNIGDPAPPLRVREWIKGAPVQSFEKGKVYVLEFWATWCIPCIAGMPHLSELARKYKDQVTVIGMDIQEIKATSLGRIKAFVDSMGNRMDYNVAAEDSNFITEGWLHAAGERMIPNAFVVDAEGRVAWIGYPTKLDNVLPEILNNTWDIKGAFQKREEQRRLAALDHAAIDTLFTYMDNPKKKDSALIVIDEMVKRNPKLKYATVVGANTFSLLLEKNPHKAYEFGKTMMETRVYEDPPYNLLINYIEERSGKLNFPAEIYELGAAAYQAQIDQYPASKEDSRMYHKMAGMYWRANNKSKAIEAEQKAIEILKSKKDFSKADLTAYESRLQQYKNM